MPENSEALEEISVQRINVVDADGTVRLVISNKDRFPDPVIDGKSVPGRQGPVPAGLIFYNDEGDECGGLVFYGKNGTAGAGLMFDQYGGNEVVALTYSEQAGDCYNGLTVVTQPRGWPGGGVFLGYGRDGTRPSIQLADSKGRTRVRVAIGDDDMPVLEVLDDLGRTVSSLVPGEPEE